MPNYAGPKWASMSMAERQPYKDMVERSDSPADDFTDGPVPAGRARMNNYVRYIFQVTESILEMFPSELE